MSTPDSGDRPSRVLFISYDGLTDPLGQSQILPYILGIHASGRRVHILSFEKPERLKISGDRVAARLGELGVGWTPLRFSRRPRYLGKAWDLLKMYVVAFWLAWRARINVIHCRSYQATQVGLAVKAFRPVQVIFDMRGFWADERLDGGIWSRHRVLDRLLYSAYKKLERWMLRRADHVISLTRTACASLAQWGATPDKVTVIPCCADFEQFTVGGSEARLAVKRDLGMGSGGPVLGYVGSLGTWYMLPEMLRLFRAVRRESPEARLLLVTLDWNEDREQWLRESEFADLRSAIVIRGASRDEVARYLHGMDLAVSFIKPAFSKLASSPTKLAEAWAAGIPVISNAGVGDVEGDTAELQAGAVVKDFAEQTYADIASHVPQLLALGGAALRHRVRSKFDLSIAVARYEEVYETLERLRP